MITNINSGTIISELQELQAAILDEDVELLGLGIDGVFDEFLESVDRGDDDFASCNLVDHEGIQSLGVG